VQVVLATDYDALLAVLRRCVEAMPVERNDGYGHVTIPVNTEEMRAAVAAAREYLEEAKP
jgi:hypothetical protein